MFSRSRALPAGFIAPCLPTTAPHPPSGDQWLHEIKHDGFRVVGGGLSLNFSRIEFTNTPIVAAESPPKHWFNGG
jgi:hypothetical protein